jgi:hypothetical protein
MKKISFLSLLVGILATSNLVAKSNYLISFDPNPNNGTCILKEVIMIPYDITTNSYGYKQRVPHYNDRNRFNVKKNAFSGRYDFLQAPYDKDQEWDIEYAYTLKVTIVNKLTGEPKLQAYHGKGTVKNIPEGKPSFELSCELY